MTLGTSPQGGILSREGADIDTRGEGRLWDRLVGEGFDWRVLGQWAAVLHLGTLVLVMTMGWHDPDAGEVALGGLPAVHLALLMATGAAAAMLSLGSARNERPAPELQRPKAAPCVDQLLAQMSHELRTPLNAMIGFSEVMLRELYGPLGNARYQEYVAHISRSGGQLLRSAEDALAVTETMSAVMADRLAARCERVMASALVREAWAALGMSAGSIKLSVTNCTACDIPCERRATVQALQHLLREAAERANSAATIEVRGRRRDGARSVVISVAGSTDGTAVAPEAGEQEAQAYPPSSATLRIMLARLLVEMQGGSLSFWEDRGGSWSACVVFPPRG
jgi:signal transduction histidine kinase